MMAKRAKAVVSAASLSFLLSSSSLLESFSSLIDQTFHSPFRTEQSPAR